MTKTVTVRHTAALAPAVAVAALNEARLDACLQAPRQSMQPAGSWVPPWRGGSYPPTMITIVISANILLHCRDPWEATLRPVGVAVSSSLSHYQLISPAVMTLGHEHHRSRDFLLIRLSQVEMHARADFSMVGAHIAVMVVRDYSRER